MRDDPKPSDDGPEGSPSAIDEEDPDAVSVDRCSGTDAWRVARLEREVEDLRCANEMLQLIAGFLANNPQGRSSQRPRPGPGRGEDLDGLGEAGEP